MPPCEKVFDTQYHLLCATCYAHLPIPRPEPSHQYLLDRPPNCLGLDPTIPGLTCRQDRNDIITAQFEMQKAGQHALEHGEVGLQI